MAMIDPRLAPQLTDFAPQLTALRSAFLLATHHGVHLPPEGLPEVVEGDMTASVTAALTAAGFRVRALSKQKWRAASALGSAYPALVPLRDGRWVILVQCMVNDGRDFAAVLDPSREADGVHLVARADFEADWTGVLLLARRAPKLAQEPRAFGLRWFVPELLRQRRLLGGVAAAAIVANLIAFAIPLLLQVLIDRVIAHQAWNTLVVVVAIFVRARRRSTRVFSYVRQRLMLVAGGKVDARLGARGLRASAHRCPCRSSRPTPPA